MMSFNEILSCSGLKIFPIKSLTSALKALHSLSTLTYLYFAKYNYISQYSSWSSYHQPHQRVEYQSPTYIKWHLMTKHHIFMNNYVLGFMGTYNMVFLLSCSFRLIILLFSYLISRWRRGRNLLTLCPKNVCLSSWSFRVLGHDELSFVYACISLNLPSVWRVRELCLQ